MWDNIISKNCMGAFSRTFCPTFIAGGDTGYVLYMLVLVRSSANSKIATHTFNAYNCNQKEGKKSK